ncbi:hypothetical protein KSS87_000828 [Heliosperma pusillum]|nr:hypothetical protein KSS87_000828 [Heliosperma pusillum]
MAVTKLKLYSAVSCVCVYPLHHISHLSLSLSLTPYLSVKLCISVSHLNLPTMTCSGETKVTTIILKVDLQCCQCYKKVKRSLCRFPQIRDQVYDEKQNTVTITVVCCSPERVMDKLCSKAGKSIKSIHIKPSATTKPKLPAATAPEPDKPKPKPASAPAPATEAKPPAPASDDKPAMKKNGSKNASKNGSKSEPPPVPKPSPNEAPKPAAPAPAPAPVPVPAPAPAPAPKPIEPAQATEPMAQWVPGYPPGPPPQVFPVSVYCDGGYPGPAGPGYYQYGRPPCPPGYYGNRCDYFSEENPSACSIM